VKQEAQLSQTDRPMLRVIEHFAKSLKIIKTGIVQKLEYGFLLAFYFLAVFCIISEIKRDIGQKSGVIKKLEWCGY